jgi:hypothetical protein
MTDLQNFELEAVTGAAIPSATVQAYVASDTHPNPGSVVAATTTDASGKWTLSGLADGTYDIKVTTGGRIKWYKGNTKHNILHLYDDTTPDPNRNLCPNGGLDGWYKAGIGSISLPTADPGVENFADGWTAYLGSGDSGTVQAEATTHATNSKYSAKFTYSRSGGQCIAYHDLPDGVWQSCKGRTIAASAWIDQIATSSVISVFIDDGVGSTIGTASNTTDTGVIVWATRAISASATRVRVGITTNRANTGSQVFYLDNFMVDFTSVQPVYAPELFDATALAAYTLVDDGTAPTADGGTIGSKISELANRIKVLTSVVTWRTALTETFATLRSAVDSAAAAAVSANTNANSRVLKSGDVMSGNLTVNGNVNSPSGSITAAVGDFTALTKGTVAVARVVSSTYTGNGGAGRLISVGFTPAFVWLRDSIGGTNNDLAWVIDGGTGQDMRFDASPTVGNGTIFDATGVTMTTGGFIVNATGGSNTSGHTYAWTAFG